MRHALLALTAAVGLFAAQHAAAADLRTDHPEQYVVVKGDTLWDIAGKFLEKPWQWPQVWQKNPQIKNPNLIYPGDVIRLVYVDGKPTLTVNDASAGGSVAARPADSVPVGAIDMARYRPFLRDVRVVDGFKQLPHVIGNEEGHLLGTANNKIYVRGLQGVAVGEAVEIFRPSMHFARSGMDVAGADLNRRGDRNYLDGERLWYGASTSPGSKDYLGTELTRVASGRVAAISGDTATVAVTETVREIRQGDRVAPAAGGGYDPYYVPTPGPLDGPAVPVVASRDGLISGGRDIIAIPLGSKQGVVNGSTYAILRPGDTVGDRIAHRAELAARADSVRMPNERVGTAMVFRTFDNMSYAIVMENAKPVRAGYLLANPDSP